MSKPFDFGRVFFPLRKGQTIPDEIRFQPLGNHAANVRKLAWYWNPNDFVKGDEDASRKRVADAAYLHDVGKPQKFGISANVKVNGKVEFSYSFKGHRFEASEPNQPWVEFLAKGHHDYSANDICRDTYKLKTLLNHLDSHHPLRFEAEKYKRILKSEPLAYAHELYILEMCDQIEAEIACRFFEDDEQAESRAFMDFTITKDDTQQNVFFVDPWIFGDDRSDFKLSLAYWSMPFPQVLKKAIEKNSQDNSTLTKQLQADVRDWWLSQPQNLKSKTTQVIIKRLPKDNLEKLKTDVLYTTIGNFLPNPMQEALAEQLDRNKNPTPAILLKSPTGSGKMESVLFPALANGHRLFLVLPARSLLEDQKERIHKYLIEFSKLPQNQNRQFSLVIDTGAQMDRWIYKDGEASKPKVNPRRHLYKGHIILTTLDKFLYRYFSFGDKQKSFIFPHRIHRQDSLFCFDEAHSYDEISFTNFQNLVKSLYEAGRALVLMTATMPEFRDENGSGRNPFDYLSLIDYIDDSQRKEALEQFQQQVLKQPYLNQRGLSWLSEIKRDPDAPEGFQSKFAQIILKEWKAKPNHRILAVVETVTDAVAIYQQLKDELGSNQDSEGQFLFLYHGRISDVPKESEFSRTNIYKKIKQRDDNGKPYVLVTTSAIEVGCDLNAKVLISQICPPENLIQRGGRCNRKGDVPDARVIVVGDRIPEFSNTLDEAGWHDYQQVLQSLTEFDAQKIGQCIKRSQHIDDYRVVELFSMLHDYVYNADLTCQPTHEKGLVITRSWTPSATLVFDDGKHGDKLAEMPQVTVPVDRLVLKKDKDTRELLNQYAETHAYERYYDQEQTRWNTRDLRGGCAYQKDIIIKVGPYSDGAIHDVSLHYSYDPELGFKDLPGVFNRWRLTGFDEKLRYEPKDGRGATLTYTKALNTGTTSGGQENAP